MRVLHAAAEMFPFVKTGGLGDVVGALPSAQALVESNTDVRIVLPGLPSLMSALRDATDVATRPSPFGAGSIRIRCGTLTDDHTVRTPKVYLVDTPALFLRDGGPYQDAAGQDWPDNLLRFATLSWCAMQIARGELDRTWRADILHAHDWHTGLVCAFLRREPDVGVRSIFTVHNLAYAGLFPLESSAELGLDSALTLPGAALEFYGHLSLLKAGLVLADRLTTVSPTYAREIATPETGCGFDGVIRSRGRTLSGILNGIDTVVWDPSRDPALAAPFSVRNLRGKQRCRRALLEDFGLRSEMGGPLFGIVSRFSPQKGLDLVLEIAPRLLQTGSALVVLGSGDAALETAFADLAKRHPGQVGVAIGYDEVRAHRLIAGADVLLVPSRFEPCGLTQLYALRYGTLPLVRRVGGLADTIDDAVGFSFGPQDASIDDALSATMAAFTDPDRWRALQQAAMARDHGWSNAARDYLALYRTL